MERLLQYWDNLDDVVGAVFLYYERLRRVVIFTVGSLLVVLLQVGGVLLALAQPPLALAMATILLVTLMYRSVTTPRFASSAT